jgi:RND superfamily putative drug exporter
MDYQVFLLSRVRERYDACGDTREAVSFGLQSTAGIITGAALIMVAVFAGLAAGEMVMFQWIGFGLAVAVALDATLVRVVVVPRRWRCSGAGTGTCPDGCSGCRT